MYFECSIPIESKKYIYCNYEKIYSHNYRTSKIKDIPIQNKEAIIRLKDMEESVPVVIKFLRLSRILFQSIIR